MNRKRKPLDDALAKSFVYGETPPPRSEKGETETSSNQDKSPSTSEETENFIPESQLENKNTTKEEPKKPTNQSSNQELSMIDKLQIKPKEATKRFTVDLPESQHRQLSILAAKTGRTKADIVRMLLEEALNDLKD